MERSESDEHHHVQASAIPDNNYLNTYMTAQNSLYWAHIFSSHQHLACSSHSTGLCQSRFHTKDGEDS